MKARTILLSLALCFVSVAVCFAQDAFMGTWKLNEAKSKLSSGAPKNSTVVYEAAGENVKVTYERFPLHARPHSLENPTSRFAGGCYETHLDLGFDSLRRWLWW